MKTKRYIARTKILIGVFLAIFISVWIFSTIYVIAEFRDGNNPITMLSEYQMFSLVVAMVVYMPLLFTICYNAKKACMRRMLMVFRVITCFFLLVTTIMLLTTFSEIIK